MPKKTNNKKKNKKIVQKGGEVPGFDTSGSMSNLIDSTWGLVKSGVNIFESGFNLAEDSIHMFSDLFSDLGVD